MLSHRRAGFALPALFLAVGVLAGSPALASSPLAAAEIHTVSGTITDAHGAPIERVNLNVRSAEGTPVAAYAQTDTSGAYSLPLAAGSYLLYVMPPGDLYGMGWWSESGFTYSMANASAIDVTAGNAPGTDLTLPDAIYIKGTVTAAGSAPIAGIEVMASRREGDATWFYYGSTDAAGAYRVDVPPAPFTVSFSDPHGVYPFVYYSRSGVTVHVSAASTVTVASKGVTGIDATLPAGLHVNGTVTNVNGVPLKEVTVRAYTADMHELGHTWTDAAGKYSLSMLPGSYRLMFEEYTRTYLSGYWSTSGPVYEPADAGAINISDTNVTANIKLPLWAPRPDPTAPPPNPTLPPTTTTTVPTAHASGLPVATLLITILAIIFLTYRRLRRA